MRLKARRSDKAGEQGFVKRQAPIDFNSSLLTDSSLPPVKKLISPEVEKECSFRRF